MATIPNGILGGIQGRVGTVTGYNRYGIDVIRSAKNKGMVKPTAKRLAQRSKITVCNAFAKAFAGRGFLPKHSRLLAIPARVITVPLVHS